MISVGGISVGKILKELIRWIRNSDMVDHLKAENTELKDQLRLCREKLLKHYQFKSKGKK